MMRFFLLIFLMAISFSSFASVDSDGNNVIAIGNIESFDTSSVVMNIRGTKVRLPRSDFPERMNIRPGKKIALTIKLGELRKHVVRR